MIRLKHGVRLSLDKDYVFDGKSVKAGEVHLISHGHYDHIPSNFEHDKVICSKVTKKIIEFRKRIKIRRMFKWNVKMLDAGHVLGSTMFLVDKKVLYTGDFNTVQKYCGKAEPRKCSTLIIDSTFGKPKYEFPEYNDITKEIRDYVEHLLKKELKIILYAYSFGKSQELCHLLDRAGIGFSVSKRIGEANDHLGLSYRNEELKGNVYITNYPQMLSSKEHVKIGFSGWAAEPYYERIMKIDKAFVLSNHCDFPSLMEFVRKCGPDRVMTHHGFNVDLAYEIRKRLGIEAEPLLEDQKLLTNFMD
ncbi:hypothetical protein JW968_02120 [Candidatus Woesearchaeota archaeon]|nr:hypothetical protein [Candidatus Woesearchaeota archaeon]